MSKITKQAKVMVNYPRGLCCFHFLAVLGAFGFLFRVMDEPLADPFITIRDLYPVDHKSIIDYDQKQAAFEKIAEGEDGQVGYRSILMENWSSSLMFESEDGNIFTPDNLRRIEEIEIEMITHPDFKDLCYADSFTDPK